MAHFDDLKGLAKENQWAMETLKPGQAPFCLFVLPAGEKRRGDSIDPRTLWPTLRSGTRRTTRSPETRSASTTPAD